MSELEETANTSVGFEHIPHPNIYKISQYLLRATTGGVHVHGTENVPDEPAVYVPSHRSLLDIPAAGVAIYKTKHEPARFMAKRELWKFALLGKWIDAVGGFPITRQQENARMNEMRPFVHSAKDGENVVVFGEGTRQEGLEIGQLFGGALMIASTAERPVVPMGIAGTKPLNYHGVHVVFGDVIEADEARELRRAKQEGLEVLRAEIQLAFNTAHQLAEQ